MRGTLLISTILATLALPAILVHLQTSVGQVAWVLISFNLVLGLVAVQVLLARFHVARLHAVLLAVAVAIPIALAMGFEAGFERLLALLALHALHLARARGRVILVLRPLRECRSHRETPYRRRAHQPERPRFHLHHLIPFRIGS